MWPGVKLGAWVLLGLNTVDALLSLGIWFDVIRDGRGLKVIAIFDKGRVNRP